MFNLSSLSVKCIIIFATLGKITNAFAGEAPKGFKTLNEASTLPKRVIEATGSVFKIYVPDGDLVTPQELSPKFTKLSLPEIKEAIKKSDKVSEVDKLVFLYQIDECLQNPKDTCKVFDSIQNGSLFVVGDGSDLMSAYHIFKSYISKKVGINSASQQNINKLFEQKIPLFAIDSHNKLIIDSRLDKITIGKTTSEALDAEVNEKFIQFPAFDFIKLKLNKKIKSPICNKSLIKSGEELYLIGYPRLTEDRKKYGLPDSDGKQMYFSQGKVLSFETAAQRVGLDIKAMSKEVLDFQKKSILASDLDSTQGFSGGPILNSEGCYVGVLSASYPADGSYAENKTTLGVSSIYLNEVIKD